MKTPQQKTKTMLFSGALPFLSRTQRRIARARVTSLPVLTESAFTRILSVDLGLENGDTVFVHSSLDRLHLGFHFVRAFSILREIVGERGTLLFPTYPRPKSYEFLKGGRVFDVRKSPSYTGILTEIARRHQRAVRSLHPTKSVCAIGQHAKELMKTHQCSAYPYDRCSPYYRIMEFGGKIIGIGVSTEKLSFVHCIEDALGDQFPVRVYHDRIFSARCINHEGKEEIVQTYAHDASRMNHETAHFMKHHIPADICKDLTIHGMRFFRADSTRLFHAMIELAKAGVTVYPRPFSHGYWMRVAKWGLRRVAVAFSGSRLIDSA